MHLLPQLPGLDICLLLLSGVTVLALQLRCLPLLAFPLAICWTTLVAGDQLAARWPATRDRTDIRLTGWVDSEPRLLDGRTAFTFRVADDAPMLAGGRLRLNWYAPAAPVRTGHRYALTLRLRTPRGSSNPGGYDFDRYLLASRFLATGYVRESHAPPARQRGWAAGVLRWRGRLLAQIRAAAPAGRGAELLAAIALGERGGFSAADWQVYQRTGTSHLVAISGLHVGLLGAGLFWCVRHGIARSRWYRRQFELACLVAGLGVTAYALLSGLALPALRALLMFCAGLAILLARVRIAAEDVVAFALVAVLAMNPLASLTASFWLSFAAVAILLAAQSAVQVGCRSAPPEESVPNRLPIRRAWWRCMTVIRLQILLTAAMMPLTIAFFNAVSVVAVPVNLVAIPLFAFLLLPLTLSVSFLLAVSDMLQFGWLSSLAVQWTRLVASLLALGRDGLGMLADMPSVLLEPGERALIVIAVTGIGTALALPWHGRSGRSICWLPLLLLFVQPGRERAAGEFELTVLDVGHGLAVVVETAGHRLLYDTAARSRTGFDLGEEVVIPALQAGGSQPLDLLIISHGDADHSGGADAVIRRFAPRRVLHGPDERLDSGEACVAGERWSWDGVNFEFLHPGKWWTGTANNSSCVLRISSVFGTALLTGDIESEAEAALLRSDRLKSDVVIVPHHGSRTSSTAGFVAATAARHAVVSAGFQNRWSFPLPDVVERWENSGAKVWNTAAHGAIRSEFTDTGLNMTAWRQFRQRYWYAGPVRDSGAVAEGAL